MAIVAMLAVSPSDLPAQAEDPSGVLSFVFENDAFALTDYGYTTGLRLSWVSPERSAPDWPPLEFLPLDPDGNLRVSLALGQSMFTPRDLSRTDLILNDRPYAGWLYSTLGIMSDTGLTLDHVMLTLGIVGPHSLAGDLQDSVHRGIGSPALDGWQQQLKDEPGIVLTYERKWRALYASSQSGAGADLIPHAGLNLGNVFTDATLGAMVRVGRDMPEDYGPPRIRPGLTGSDFFDPTSRRGGYLFGGVDMRAVVRNIFLDGNTFTESHHVDKNPLVATLQLGAVYTWNEVRISYTHVFMTAEFDGQETPGRFGSLSVSCRY